MGVNHDARCQARDDHGLRCMKAAGHLGPHQAYSSNDSKGGSAARLVTWP